jgi:hypothetical protein
MICRLTPLNILSNQLADNTKHQNGPALGAQAGEPGISQVVKAGGFKRFRRAIQTPFNIVYEAKP